MNYFAVKCMLVCYIFKIITDTNKSGAKLLTDSNSITDRENNFSCYFILQWTKT